MKKFLVVEDDPVQRSHYCRYVKEAFLEAFTVEAEDGSDALKLMGRDDFDAIITDGQMHPMGGIELIRQVRGLNKTLPILMITGHRPTAEEARQIGATKVLEKPVAPSEFARSIGKLFENEARRGGPTPRRVFAFHIILWFVL